ncbi:MAG: MipA/OmpV family protein [Candidatus Omnitrophica bacterium]|nr:MipA/OmpV family protein [Candidatus Omnitrophota bacterium]
MINKKIIQKMVSVMPAIDPCVILRFFCGEHVFPGQGIRMKQYIRRAAAILILISFAPGGGDRPCAAEERSAGAPSKRWSAGVGAIYTDNPYKGTDGHDFLSIPFVSFRGSWLTIQGPQVSCLLKKWEQIALAGMIEYRFGGYDADDSDDLAGMTARRQSVDAGLSCSLPITRYAQASFSVLRDILRRHRGVSGRLTVASYVPYKKWFVSPYCGLQLLNKTFSDYYFGVRAAEARAGRPEYHPGTCYNPIAGVRAGYTFAEAYTAVLGAEIKVLDPAIADSPIVGEERMSSIQAAVLYQF